MARKLTHLASDASARLHAPYDLFVACMGCIDRDFDAVDEDIIDEINAGLLRTYDRELTPRDRALRGIGA